MADVVSAESIVVATREQAWCELEGDAVIVNLASEIYYGLDAVGARVWNLIQEPAPVRAICHALTAEYDVDADRCERDVIAFLRELAAAGLVEVRGGER